MSRRFLAVFILATSSALGAETENVYIKLYEARLESSRLNAKKRIQEHKYQLAQLARLQRLAEQKATAAAEVEQWELAAKVAELAVQDADVQILEAATMRDIAKERVALGLDMPICPGNPVR